MYGSQSNGAEQRLREQTTPLQRVERVVPSVLRVTPLLEKANGKTDGLAAARPATVQDWLDGTPMHKKGESRDMGEREKLLVYAPMPKLEQNGNGFRTVGGMNGCCGPDVVAMSFEQAEQEVKGRFVVETMRKAENGDFAAGKQLYMLSNGKGERFMPVGLEHLRMNMGINTAGSRGEMYVRGEVVRVERNPHYKAPEVRVTPGEGKHTVIDG